MKDSQEELAEYATRKAQDLCSYLERETHGIYNTVMYSDQLERPRAQCPCMFLHRSEPYIWDRGVLFTLFAVDVGDLVYEPRLQVVEEALRRREEVTQIGRTTAPDSMMKDMLTAEVVVRERRQAGRHAIGANDSPPS